MKRNKLLFQFFLFSSLGLIYLTMSSDINGRYNGGTSCSSCHGSKNTATTVTINGLPSTFVTGQVYNLTLTIANSTNAKAGCNVMVSAGMLGAGTGSKVNTAKTQLTHTAPKSAVSGTTTFDFTWTAPASTTAVTFSAVGNAVNDDGNASSLDQWNSTTATVPGSFPANVNESTWNSLKIYPNPVYNDLVIEGFAGTPDQLRVFDCFGQCLPVSSRAENGRCVVSCSNLPSGYYFIAGGHQGQQYRASFLKQ